MAELARVILQTGDRRRVVVFPNGGWQVEEWVPLKTGANPNGAWYLSDDALKDTEQAGMMVAGYAALSKSLAALSVLA